MADVKSLVILLTVQLWMWNFVTDTHAESEVDFCREQTIMFTTDECRVTKTDRESDKDICETDVNFLCRSNNNAYKANVDIQAFYRHLINNPHIENCSTELTITSVTVCESVSDGTMLPTTQPTEWTESIQTTQLLTSAVMSKKVTAITGLGASVGLLMVVLVGVTVGWICTCWIMMKRGQEIKNLKRTTNRNDHPSIHQETVPIPFYETIMPAHQSEKRQLAELAAGKGCSNCNNLQGKIAGTIHMENCGQEDSTTLSPKKSQGGDYSLLERTAASNGLRDIGQGGDYSLLERTVASNGARDVGQDSDYSLLVQTEKINGVRGMTQDGDYSKLETLTLVSKTTGDGATCTTVSKEEGVKSDNQREDGEVTDEASSGGGVLQLENENSEKGPHYEEPEMLPIVTSAGNTGNMGNELANEENDDPSMTTNPCYKKTKMTPK